MDPDLADALDFDNDLPTGVQAVDVTQFEDAFQKRVDSALTSQELGLEQGRLERTLESMRALQERIERTSSVARLGKLLERMDELRNEETMIRERMANLTAEQSSPPKSPIVETKRKSTMMIEGEENVLVAPAREVGQFLDDGDEVFFRKRIQDWIDSLENPLDYEPEFMWKVRLVDQPDHCKLPDLVEFGDRLQFRASKRLWNSLLDYQKLGIEWLLRLFEQRKGGILGDEMGLGKTIQIVGLIACLQASKRLSKPVLIVCPATLLAQWVQEFHRWWPYLRVIVLHSSGTLSESPKEVIDRVVELGHVLITSYGNMTIHQQRLGKIKWRLVVLDEGHKIRNPDAAVTLICKQINTSYRIILSGTPIQNNLIELWSLFDFCCPGLLGTLATFKTEISGPISSGGWVNASSLQVQTSYKCACLLRDLIKPFLLRRVKADVATELPPKQEQVLFCTITEYQRELYQRILDSPDIQAVLDGRRNVLAGIDLLRKVCNHPDLLWITRRGDSFSGEEDEDDSSLDIQELKEQVKAPCNVAEKSGKLMVLRSVLAKWVEHGHRALIFCQTRQMLELIEDFVISQAYRYLRMDGTTPIATRMSLVESFNNPVNEGEAPFLMLLTTKVGGLGINLTGADRVIIFDPDWNPSTDIQARERAWRLGQTKPVSIYRFITAGTIEEKIYHRQIFKQYLSNRILNDPKQARFFKTTEMYDLFTLAPPDYRAMTETGELFEGMMMESTASPKEATANQDNVLDSLLEVSGLHSTLQHDKLIERSRQEVLLVEKEAVRQAALAAEALRRSAELEPPRFDRVRRTASFRRVPSSAEIIEHVRDRNNPDSRLAESQGKVLEGLIEWLGQRGPSSSDDVASWCNNQSNRINPLVFRHMLKTVADFDKYTKLWSVKRGLIE